MKDLGNGLFLFTSEELIYDQATWDDLDRGKAKDFTTSPLWLCTDCGALPEGFNTEAEIMKYITKGD